MSNLVESGMKNEKAAFRMQQIQMHGVNQIPVKIPDLLKFV